MLLASSDDIRGVPRRGSSYLSPVFKVRVTKLRSFLTNGSVFCLVQTTEQIKWRFLKFTLTFFDVCDNVSPSVCNGKQI